MSKATFTVMKRNKRPANWPRSRPSVFALAKMLKTAQAAIGPKQRLATCLRAVLRRMTLLTLLPLFLGAAAALFAHAFLLDLGAFAHMRRSIRPPTLLPTLFWEALLSLDLSRHFASAREAVDYLHDLAKGLRLVGVLLCLFSIWRRILGREVDANQSSSRVELNPSLKDRRIQP